MADTDRVNRFVADLRQQIPLAAAMGLELARFDDRGLAFAFPLAPNINDKGIAFGGSLVSGLLLAGWAWMSLRLESDGLAAKVLIARSQQVFIAPLAGGYECVADAAADYPAFAARLRERGKAKLDLKLRACAEGVDYVQMEASFAALIAPASPPD